MKLLMNFGGFFLNYTRKRLHLPCVCVCVCVCKNHAKQRILRLTERFYLLNDSHFFEYFSNKYR
jgi:hypothetical protein